MSLLPELTERRKTTTYLNNSTMSYIEDNFNEKPVIVIDEKPDVVPGQTEGEVPVMIIENDNDSDENNTINITTTKNMRWLWMLGSILVAIITTIVLALGYKYYRSTCVREISGEHKEATEPRKSCYTRGDNDKRLYTWRRYEHLRAARTESRDFILTARFY